MDNNYFRRNIEEKTSSSVSTQKLLDKDPWEVTPIVSTLLILLSGWVSNLKKTWDGNANSSKVDFSAFKCDNFKD